MSDVGETVPENGRAKHERSEEPEQANGEGDRAAKRAKVEEEAPSAAKPKEDGASEDQAPAPEKKIFGSGLGQGNWSKSFTNIAASTPSIPANVFGQSSTKISFGSFASGNENVFAKPDPAAAPAVPVLEQIDVPKTTSVKEWVSPFSVSFGAKPKAEEKEEFRRESSPQTGEENETTDFSARGKLYFFDADEKKDWRERGVGLLKLNTAQGSSSSRLVMRSDGNLRLILNVKLFDGMLVELASDKSVRFAAIESEKKMSTFLLRTRNKDDSQNLIKAIQAKVEITVPPKRAEGDFPVPARSQSSSEGNTQEKEKENEKDTDKGESSGEKKKDESNQEVEDDDEEEEDGDDEDGK